MNKKAYAMRRNPQFPRSALVLLGAFTCAFCLGVTAHELGHAAVIRLFGITQMRIILHPFGASRITWDADPALLGYVDAAGPLGNVLAGTGVMLLLWRKRSPYLLPLLTWGPMACVQEGFTSTMQLLFHIPGTDATRVVAAGVPYTFVLGVAILFLLLGVITFCLQLPILGISTSDSFWRRWRILVTGLAPYMGIILLTDLFSGSSDISRGLALLAFAVLLATLLAAIYKPLYPLLDRLTHTDAANVSWGAAWAALGSGSGIVAAGLLLFNS